MRFEKTKKGVILGLAITLLSGGIAFGSPSPAAAPQAVVQTNLGHESPDRSEKRVSRSSDRTTPPQKKNIVVKKKNSVVKKKVVKQVVKKKPAKRTHKKVKVVKPGSNRALGKRLAASRGWGTGRQWVCLEQLWTEESGWRTNADNPNSDAYGIPQALPGSKMGPGWQSSATVQIRWGLKYIDGRYGTPCNALATKHSQGWY